jgi:hypothetical protein
MRKLILIGIAALATVNPLRAAPAVGNSPPSTEPAGVAQAVTVTVDTDSTKAVLDAVLNPALTMAEALRIAALPGNQGLIRKARSYGRPGTDELFAKALVAAAHRDDAAEDPGKFRFGPVRDHAAQIRATLAKLEDPASNLLARVKARIAEFTPSSLSGHATGYLIVGGTSGGFAFGGPEFFLKQVIRNVGQAGRSSTLLELSIHGLTTRAKLSYDDIYALGFYGDQVLYGLGYVMARAIAAEEGKGAIAALTGRPGALFVQRYRKLKSYGKSEDVPVLFPATLQAAEQLAACAEGVR